MSQKPLPLGTLLKTDWKVSAVVWTGGERYYILENEHGDVSLMPAFVVEEEREKELEREDLAHSISEQNNRGRYDD